MRQFVESKDSHRNVEMVDTAEDVHLDSSILESTGSQAEAATQVEFKIQQLLSQLTALTNKQYGKGKHVYDYQLVKLSEKQAKAQQAALEQADQVFYKHSTLKRQEKEMNQKFDDTKKQLDTYKETFYKDKHSLQ
jgi:hypothetical protein